MPSVGRGGMRTTRQGGPPSRVVRLINEMVEGVVEGRYYRLDIVCPDISRDMFDAALSYLLEREPGYVAVDAVRMWASARDEPQIGFLVEAALSSLAASGAVASWRATRMGEEVAAEGLGRALEMARSEDRGRRLFSSLVLTLAEVLGSSTRYVGRREAAALIRYADLRGLLLLYRWFRLPPPGDYRGVVFVAAAPMEPGDGAAVICRRGQVEAVLPGGKAYKAGRL